MKDEIRKELEELKRQRDALLKKNPELKALEEVDIPPFLRQRKRRHNETETLDKKS